MHDKPLETLIQGLNILIVDGNAFMRRLTRTMLMNLGAKSVIEAVDGLTALDMIRDRRPRRRAARMGCAACSTAWR